MKCQNPIEEFLDKEIGKKLKTFREVNNIKKKEVADLLVITIQQLDKYERGLNRISSSKLIILIRHFDIDPLYFFETYQSKLLESEADKIFHKNYKSSFHAVKRSNFDKLLISFTQIKDIKIQSHFLDLISSMASKFSQRNECCVVDGCFQESDPKTEEE